MRRTRLVLRARGWRAPVSRARVAHYAVLSRVSAPVWCVSSRVIIEIYRAENAIGMSLSRPPRLWDWERQTKPLFRPWRVATRRAAQESRSQTAPGGKKQRASRRYPARQGTRRAAVADGSGARGVSTTTTFLPCSATLKGEDREEQLKQYINTAQEEQIHDMDPVFK